MGGIFGSPSPPPPPPPPLPALPDPEEELREARRQNIARRRRGRAGTIATSPRGVLNSAQGAAQRKTLLGE